MILGLSPMDGITDCAFRQITKNVWNKYGDKNKYQFFLWTEFMNADGYCINPTGLIRHILATKIQNPLIAQIFGGEEEYLLQCFLDIEKKYSDYFYGLELNLGCPSKTVMKCGGGSALLREKEGTLEMIKRLRKKISLPFSIKSRAGLDDEDKGNQLDFLIKSSDYVNHITIHGRTVKQGYALDADWDFIYELKKLANKNCKIIGNGGIKTFEDIDKKVGNLDGVLIGQTAIGNPWIFTNHTPDIQEIKETILEHLKLMVYYNSYFKETIKNYNDILTMPDNIESITIDPMPNILHEFRKFLFQYIKGIEGSKEFKQKISTINDYNILVDEINNFLKS